MLLGPGLTKKGVTCLILVILSTRVVVPCDKNLELPVICQDCVAISGLGICLELACRLQSHQRSGDISQSSLLASELSRNTRTRECSQSGPQSSQPSAV